MEDNVIINNYMVKVNQTLYNINTLYFHSYLLSLFEAQQIEFEKNNNISYMFLLMFYDLIGTISGIIEEIKFEKSYINDLDTLKKLKNIALNTFKKFEKKGYLYLFTKPTINLTPT